MHPDDLTPRWLTFALREGGIIKKASVKEVTRSIIGDGKGFKSSVVRVGLTYDCDEPGAPSSLVAKIEPEDKEIQFVNQSLNSFQREINFYKEIAPTAPIRLPVLYYAVEEPPSNCLLMEDLSAYTPGDQIVGMHKEKVTTTLENMGKLQAKYWNNDLLDELSWMPTLEDLFNQNDRDDFIVRALSFLEHFGFLIGVKGLSLAYKLKDNIDWIKNEMLSRDKTIVHFDLREDNLVFGESGTENEVIILDWQLAIRSMGALDVARLIGGSEIPSERTGHQEQILRHWYDTLIGEGVRDYSWDDALYDLKLGALAYLGVFIHSHKDFLSHDPRVRELGKIVVGGIFSSAVEIDAGSVLP